MNIVRKTLQVSIISLCGLVAACSWAPLKEIRPRADYITVGVQKGDRVEIETTDGRTHKFEVTEVTGTAVVGKKQRVEFADIESIGIRSWGDPPHPCGGGKPVGCSIPEVVLVLSQDYKEQADKFHAACVKHDFCYRHGFATYGIGRAECDEVFYEEMKTECSGTGMLGVLDVKTYGICQVAARQTYEAVRRYGEPAFLTTTSTYCDYK